MNRTIVAALLLMTTAAFAQTAPSNSNNVADLLNNAPPVTATLDGVVLSANPGGDVRLQPLPGTFSTTYAFVTVLAWMNYQDLHSSVRTTDKRPTLHLKMGANPKGRAYLVKVESNKKTANRSLKVGHSGFGSVGDLSAPDRDWVVEASLSEESPGIWKMTPNSDLAPGEYGVFAPNAAGSIQVAASGNLYDFGIDN